jgi:hypothetical protein
VIPSKKEKKKKKKKRSKDQVARQGIRWFQID